MTRFCSAMPTLTKRSGKASANAARPVTSDTSAERATTSGRRDATSRSAVPNGPALRSDSRDASSTADTTRLHLLSDPVPLVVVDSHEVPALALGDERDAVAELR